MGIVGAALATAIAYSVACVILLIFYLPHAGVSLFDVLVAKRDDLQFFWETTRRLVQRGKLRALGAGR
jgi:Na+-driven multidrug efflux pump